MTAFITYFIAGSGTSFLVLWIINSYQELSCKRKEVNVAQNQVQIHFNDNNQENESSNAEVTQRMLATSRMIYAETVRGYNAVLLSPKNHFFGLMMGFRKMSETDNISHDIDEN